MHQTTVGLTRLVAASIGLLLTVSAQEPAAKPTGNPLLWRIEGEVPSYLFGTFHLPDPRITTLHPEVEQAIEKCDALFTELPMDHMPTAKETQLMMLPKGRNLSDELPPAVMRSLQELFEARKMKLEPPVDRMKPMALCFFVLTIDHMKDYMGKTPLDMLIYKMAKDADKEVGGLETVAEQFGAMQGISDADSAAYLADTIDKIESRRRQGGDFTEDLVKAYLDGSEEKLDEGSWPADRELTARFQKVMVIDRNVRMTDRIAAKLVAEPKRRFFFAVGAAHLVHESGIVALLRARGHAVTRLPETAATIEAELRELEAKVRALHERIETLRQRQKELKKAG